MTKIFTAVAAAVFLSGCATITSGGPRSIAVETQPPGATCEVRRSDNLVGTVPTTPGVVLVTASMRSMNVRCRRPAETAGPYGVAVIAADLNPWYFGNILIGGFIGMIIDMASGAAGTYPSSVSVAMPAIVSPVVPEFVPEPEPEPQPRVRSGRRIS
jgi:hypothetical protein